MRSILTTLLCGALAITVSSSRQSPFAGSSRIPEAIAVRIMVLTFDDAVKSQRTLVAPLLKQLGFGATFFVTHRWMDDSEHFLTWKEIAEISEMGFEIGNHREFASLRGYRRVVSVGHSAGGPAVRRYQVERSA